MKSHRIVRDGGKVEESWRKVYEGGEAWREIVKGDMEERREGGGGKIEGCYVRQEA